VLFIKIYSFYLSFFEGMIDPFTRFTAYAVRNIYTFFHLPSQVIPTRDQGIKLLIENHYVARIVEGCNAVSIIILFMAFILAFRTFNKRFFAFLFIGILSIAAFNILRIALLGYILYAFPAYQDFWHRIVFPGLIYSWIVLLWVLFINKVLVKK
jgi:exosortase family protein XrtF